MILVCRGTRPLFHDDIAYEDALEHCPLCTAVESRNFWERKSQELEDRVDELEQGRVA